MIYSFFLFNRRGSCLYYEEFNAKKEASMNQALSSTEVDEDIRLMFGLIFSL